MSLKEKAISGVLWNAAGTTANIFSEFIIGIVLARILSPKEFGLIGMIIVFISISYIFINSGFSQALIRKEECKEKDLSTTFYFNILVGFLIYLSLYFLAPYISAFFNESQLVNIIRVLGITLIISSLTIVQRVLIIRKVDFKINSRVTFISSIISGIISITLALSGFGVWALVYKTISKEVCNSIQFWLINRWIPKEKFSKKSFNELFGFGSKLLLSGIFGTIINNVTYLTIGKLFSPVQLGYYTRAEMFKNMPSVNVEGILSSVAYPVLSQVQSDKLKLKEGFKRLLLSSHFLIAINMTILAAIAKPLTIVLIGEKWLPAAEYLSLLCILGFMYPLLTVNVNIFNVVGRSDLYLKLQFAFQVLGLSVIFLGYFYNIRIMIYGMVINYIIIYFLYSFFSERFTNYSTKDQIIDLMPISIISFLVFFLIVLLGKSLEEFNVYFSLFIQIISGYLLIFLLSHFSKNKTYLYIKDNVLSNVLKNK